MPDVARYKNKKHFMQNCMHINKEEGLSIEQSLGKCINIWRQEHPENPKKRVAQKIIYKYLNKEKGL